jgi:TonB-dependent starch-binding outer membrane protein SusC
MMMDSFQTIKKWLYGAIVLLMLLQGVNLHAQIAISGKVLDANDGSSLPGATVLVKGTSSGSITDLDGDFEIEVPSKESILVFKFIGYVEQEITVGDRSDMLVRLTPSLTNLDEVVVTGFGTQIKRELTGSIGNVSSEEILKVNNNTFQNSIQGAISGVSVTGTSGALGTPSFVRIRGIGSLNSIGDPLYILDGVVMQAYPISEMASFGATSNFLASINPADIESVEILKDASAAAIYGSRGANGVIIITTKGVKKGPLNMIFSMNKDCQIQPGHP